MNKIAGALWIWLAIATIFSSSCVMTERADKRLYTSVCKLSALGPVKSGIRVRVRAIYISDIVERTTLKDSDCPDVWADLAERRPPNEDQSVAKFEDAVRGDVVNDAELRQFILDVSGVYTRRSNQSQGTIAITNVWSFERIHGDWTKATMPK